MFPSTMATVSLLLCMSSITPNRSLTNAWVFNHHDLSSGAARTRRGLNHRSSTIQPSASTTSRNTRSLNSMTMKEDNNDSTYDLDYVVNGDNSKVEEEITELFNTVPLQENEEKTYDGGISTVDAGAESTRSSSTTTTTINDSGIATATSVQTVGMALDNGSSTSSGYGNTPSTISANSVRTGDSSTGGASKMTTIRRKTKETTAPTASSSSSNRKSKNDTMAKKIERITEPRSYPLFLAEKAAEAVESTLNGIAKRSIVLNAANAIINEGNKKKKERVVILGTGWGAVSYLREIDTDLYDVTVISPRNYFLFTPMLAAASVGTVKPQSITQSIQQINSKVRYIEGTATDIDPTSQKITYNNKIEDTVLEYDRLIVTVGSQTNTFGTPGVRENCCLLRQIDDATKIKASIVKSFERAKKLLADQQADEDQLTKLLTFAIIGAGPTGIEFASELRDFIEEDGPKYYPHLLKYVRIKVIQASSTVLAPFDESLQQEAMRRLNRAVDIQGGEEGSNLDIPESFRLTELILENAVKEVGPDTITLSDETVLPYGVAVWAAGNGPLPFSLELIDSLGEDQARLQDGVARGRIAIDQWMRAIGGEGKILALGDCTYLVNNQLPATAQVANQQGVYLANLMNKRFNLSPPTNTDEDELLPPVVSENTVLSLSDAIANFATSNNDDDGDDGEKTYAKPFQFLDLGILAYTGGGSALAEVKLGPNMPTFKGTGVVGNTLWRGVYLSNQVSMKNRLLVLDDWRKKELFGRDIKRL